MFPPFSINLNDKSTIVGNNVFIDAKINEALVKMERDTINIIGAYRNGYMKQFSDLLIEPSTFPEELKAEIRRIGTPNSGAYFRPHVTLCYNVKLKGAIQNIISTLSLSRRSCEIKVNSISIGRLGYHGNVEQVLKTFNLTG